MSLVVFVLFWCLLSYVYVMCYSGQRRMAVADWEVKYIYQIKCVVYRYNCYWMYVCMCVQYDSTVLHAI